MLRPRILAFLGRGGASSEALAQCAALAMPSSSASSASATAAAPGVAAAAIAWPAIDGLTQWDLHRRAGLPLPFDIGRLVFWLDPLLPQVPFFNVMHVSTNNWGLRFDIDRRPGARWAPGLLA